MSFDCRSAHPSFLQFVKEITWRPLVALPAAGGDSVGFTRLGIIDAYGRSPALYSAAADLK